MFCSLCGVKIRGRINNFPDDQAVKDQSSFRQIPIPAITFIASNEPMVLHLVDSGEIIRIGNKKELTVGRTGDGQQIVPEIDLTEYGAYSAGVSRLHVNLSINSSKVTVQDLDSANGTRLNGSRLTPQTKYKLKHGDILTLGTLKVQIIIQE